MPTNSTNANLVAGGRAPLNVFFTVDTEVWPERPDWRETGLRYDIERDLDGKTAEGEFGTAYQARTLAAHNLKGVFFVETLYSYAVGLDTLRKTVESIRSFGHEIGLHTHPEWLKRIGTLLPGRTGRLMNSYSLEEQRLLIGKGVEQLQACGVPSVCCYRAGGFGANMETLAALAQNRIPYDSSYNACWLGATCQLDTGLRLLDPSAMAGVYEFPVAVFEDWPAHYRPAQLCAASSGEMEAALWRAWENDWHSFVIVSHSFELVKRWDSRGRLTCLPNPTVIRRFHHLCKVLAQNRDKFRTSCFAEVDAANIPSPPRARLFRTGMHRSIWRMGEQAYKRWF